MKKKLLLTLIVSIALCGSLFAQYNPDSHWPDFYYPNYGDQEQLVAGIKIDGNIIDATYPSWNQLEVAAFITNAQGEEECRANWIFLIDDYVLLYGDPFPIIDGAPIFFTDPGDELYFKMYDHANGIEYDICNVTYLGEPITIYTGEEHSEGWNDPDNPIILDFSYTQVYDSHWPNFSYSNYNDQEGLVAAIMIDGVIIDDTYPSWNHLEVAAFITNAQGEEECRANWIFLDDYYVLQYGDPFPIIDGAPIFFTDPGDELYFKMYDHANGIEYDICNVTYLGQPITIHTGEDHSEGWDDPYNPIILDFTIANHWTPQSSNYADNMAIYAVIQINGEEQASNRYEVGAFCNDECRGAAIPSLFGVTNRYLVIMMVYGNEGDELQFKLYDHNMDQELDYALFAPVTFDVDGYGTPLEPYVLNFLSPVAITAVVDPEGTGWVTGTGNYTPGSTCNLIATANTGYYFINWTLNGTVVSTIPSYQFVVTEAAEYVANFNYVQTCALIAGWNWYSTYIEMSGIDGLTMLENSLGANGMRIQGRNGIVEYYEYQGNYGWYGTLTSINDEQMYRIRTSAACNAVISGALATTTNHPITINRGWNWIGFPNKQSVNVTVAMNGFTPADNDVIKGRNSTTTYLADYNMWYGTLNSFEPGQGYMYKSNSNTAKTLVFNTDAKEDVIDNITAENNIFVPNDAEYANNMLVTAVINIDGEELHSDDYELAAFVGGECRGSVKLMYVEPLDRYVAFLLVYGDETADMSFILTDGTETRWSDDEMIYAPDAIVGTLREPATLHFGYTGINENEVNAAVYPNPTKDVFNVKCEGIQKVEVINAFGQVFMVKEANGDDIQLDLGDNVAGAYMVRIFTDNGLINKQIIKK
jgi:hypothetical protein